MADEVSTFATPPVALEIEQTAKALADKATSVSITTQREAESASALLAQVKNVEKRSEEARKALTKPLNDHVKFINGTFKERTQPLTAAKKKLGDALTAFTVEEQRKADEARRRAEEAARAERQRLEAEAQARHERERTTAMLAGEDEPAPEDAPPVPDVVAVYVPPPPKVRTAAGSVVTTRRWTHKVDDVKTLALNHPGLVQPDDVAIRTYFRAQRDNGVKPEDIALPGVTFFQDASSTVR